MKLSTKTILASALIAATGGAQAAILSGFATGASDGDLFISLFRDTTTPAPQTMIIDTNVSLLGLANGTVTGWSSNSVTGLTSAIQTFLQSAGTSSFRFNAGGVTNSGSDFFASGNKYYAAYVTTNDPINGSLNMDASGMNTLRTDINTYVTQINNGYSSTDLISGINAGAPGYYDSSFWGDHIAGALPSVMTAGGVGPTLNLWDLYNASQVDFGFELGIKQLGQLQINAQTGELTLTPSAVPVPAALWLFGSGLIGLVGVSRRKG
jgi:hypothetical protein